MQRGTLGLGVLIGITGYLIGFYEMKYKAFKTIATKTVAENNLLKKEIETLKTEKKA